MSRIRNAFTLMELLIVVILVGIVAAFAIPSYDRARDRAYEREAADNLYMISSAMEMYKVRDNNDGYPASNLPQWTNINATLGMGLIEHRMVYSCTSSAGSYTCTAAHPSGWRIVISDGGVPTCNNAPCPTQPIGGTY